MNTGRYILFGVMCICIYLSTPSAFSISSETASLNEEGVKALNAKKFHKAIELFNNALKDSPDNEIIKKNISNAYNNYGYEQLKRGETLNAIDNFERALRHNPSSAYALINMGQAYYKKNDLEKALTHLRHAQKINPGIKGLTVFIEKIEREVKVESGLRKFETMHFVIVSDYDINVNNLANIRISLEQAYSRVGALFDYFPQQKTGVVIYPEKAYQGLMKGKPYWAHAFFDGKIRLPLSETIYSKDFLLKIIYHEYSHAVVRLLTKGNCPIWLNEGIACYSEHFAGPRHKDFFKTAITKDTFVPFAELPEDYSGIKNSRDANLLYREFYLIVSFIKEKYGTSALQGILHTLGQGNSIDEALRVNLSITKAEFGEAWRAYVRNKLGL